MKTPEQIARETYDQEPGKNWAVGSGVDRLNCWIAS